MTEIKVSDILTEYFELVKKIESLIDEYPLLKERFDSVTTSKNIYREVNKGEIYTLENGLLSLRQTFYSKSEKFENGIYYKIVKFSSHANKHILIQICLTEDFILFSDSKAFINMTVYDYYTHSTVRLIDKSRNQSFTLREMWLSDKDCQFDNVIFEKYIDKFFMRI